MRKIYFLSISLFLTVSLYANLYEQAAKMGAVMKYVTTMYVDTVDLQKVTDKAIEAMLKELDPHSAFLSADELRQATEQLDGNFEGIGIQFQIIDDTLNVIQTISGCPSEKVGVLPGDKIVYVGDSLIAGNGTKNQTIQKLLRGPKGTIVAVRIKRQGEKELLEFNITRDKIPIYTVDAGYMLNKTVGYIKVNSFGAKTHEEFMEKWHKLKRQGAKKLVVDLQGNGGGYLKTAFDLADEFLTADRLVVYTEGLHQPKQVLVATNKGELHNVPVVVLVDEYSASASEILSGAIQDWDRGMIVGRRTFGKGLVQRQMDLIDGSAIRLTTSRYYTPSGRCIQKPYKNVDYQSDLENRYRHGECVSQDSIHLPDSLKFTTLVEHRTVYGGGGIMPDVFVPADTTRYSAYYRRLVAKGIVNQQCVKYVQDNRERLLKQYPTIEKYMQGFEVPTKLVTDIIEQGKQQEIEYDEQQFAQSEKYIYLQLKALIARDLWTMQEYYRIYNAENDALKRALELLK